MSLPYFFLKGTSGVGQRGGQGEGLPYKSERDARCLAYGGQLQNLVSLRVFGMKSQYIGPLGCSRKNPHPPDGWDSGNSRGRGGRRLQKSRREGGLTLKKSSAGVISTDS